MLQRSRPRHFTTVKACYCAFFSRLVEQNLLVNLLFLPDPATRISVGIATLGRAQPGLNHSPHRVAVRRHPTDRGVPAHLFQRYRGISLSSQA
jgi:hypothetical protein